MPRQKTENKNKGSGLIVENFGGKKKILHKLTGFIHKDFNSVLMNYG